MAKGPNGKNIELTMTSIGELGYGLGQKAGQTISVARTAVGDRVLVTAPAPGSKWTQADLIRVLESGPERVESRCSAFTQGCGGCQWLHLSDQAQRHWKEKNTAQILRTRAHYTGKIEPLAGLEKNEAYRNKLSLKNSGGKLVFIPEFDQVTIAPRECFVQTPALQKAWNVLRTVKVSAPIEQLHLRSNASGQVGIHAFVKGSSNASIDAELKAIFEAVPSAVGIGATTRQGYRNVYGEPTLKQTWNATSWAIPHNGFFQTNEVQAGVLLETVIRAAKVTKTSRVLDLYCGSGFFALAFAKNVREVVGIEENAQSILAAQESARISGIANAQFVAGDVGDVLSKLEKKADEIAVVDPPREGLLPRALEAIVARAVKRIVYVSCYPPSLARDFKAFVKAGWKGVYCAPIDMFPNTSHVEIVMVLERV